MKRLKNTIQSNRGQNTNTPTTELKSILNCFQFDI